MSARPAANFEEFLAGCQRNGVPQGQLVITCGPRDSHNNRMVLAELNGALHRDCFDTDRAFGREKFRSAVASKFGLGEDAHGWLEEEINRQADAADDSKLDARDTAIVKPASEYQLQTVDWAWTDYIPAAAITIIDGDPGLGKSQFTCWLAASVSNHRRMPDASSVPDNLPTGVLMLSAEDDPNRTIRPRLEAVGGDLNQIKFFAGIETFDGDERGFTLPRDVDLLERVVNEHGVGLVVIDPFVAYLDGSLSMNNDSHVRQALKPLAAMAERTGAAVILLRHLNKKDGSSTMYRGGGSIGIIGAARAAYVVAKPEDDPTLRVLAPVKMNLAPMPPSMLFSIESHGTTSRVEWGGSTEVTADALLNRSQPSSTGKMAKAVEIITSTLANGPRGEREVFAACEDAGVSRSTYWRARKQLEIVSERTDFDGEWMLSLPNPQESQTFI